LGAYWVDTIEDADIVVYMTCCVREAADVRLYGQVASMKNLPIRQGNPLKKRYIAIGGCIAQRDGQKLCDELSNVDLVFGTNNIGELPLLLEQAISDSQKRVVIKDSTDEFPTSLPTHREVSFSAWLPIMIGCNNFCSYCIVPYVRGREKSRPLDEIIEEAKAYLEEGVVEITLLGQNVNSYGHDRDDGVTFSDVIKAMDALGVQRLRFATSHPKDISDDVIACFGTCKSLQPALHLPVQSGSNRILKEMNRRYTREHYLECIKKLRDICPDIALSTDIIVGFPGETEEDFMDTYSLVEEVGYSQVFTFIYSKREGTRAATMEQNATREEIQDRFDRLVDLVQRKAFEMNQPEKGRIVPVLIEQTSKRDELMLSGKSPKNQTVHAPIPKDACAQDYFGKIVNVAIDECKTWYLSGHIVD